MIRFPLWILLAASLAVTSPAWAAGEAGSSNGGSASQDIVAAAKVFCSLKRIVPTPFSGVVEEILVRTGQPIKSGEELIRYRLDGETALALRRRVSAANIADLESKLAELATKAATAEARLKEIRQLNRENMSPAQNLALAEKEASHVGQQRVAAAQRLQTEKTFLKDTINQVSQSLGTTVRADQVPTEGLLTAPISGHVIAINSELRPQAAFGPGLPALIIGVMDPMTVLAQVHEIDVVKIKTGQAADLILDAFPGRTFRASVGRISWATTSTGLDQPSYYEVELTLPNPDMLLREGQRGRVTFRTNGKHPVEQP